MMMLMMINLPRADREEGTLQWTVGNVRMRMMMVMMLLLVMMMMLMLILMMQQEPQNGPQVCAASLRLKFAPYVV